MSERDPFEQLGDLIDEPVMPRAQFAAELRSRLMSDMSASPSSREEHRTTMDGAIDIRPRPVPTVHRPRRIRPLAIVELAAAVLIVLGLAATLGRGWFGNDPQLPTSLPMAALQGDGTPTAEVPVLEPTVAPPDGLAGTLWALPLPAGESLDFGGMLVEDGTVYRLLSTPSFVGIQAVDGASGTVEWQRQQPWAGNLFVIEDGTIYLDGGGNSLAALDLETGEPRWQVSLDGNPIAIATDDEGLYVQTDIGGVTALDQKTGDRLWTARGSMPANAAPGWAVVPGRASIDVEDGVVAFVPGAGVLTALDAESGEQLWSLEGFGPSVTIVAEDGRFIVMDSAGPDMAVGFGVGSAPVETISMTGSAGTPDPGQPASVRTDAAGPGQGCGVTFGVAGVPAEAAAGASTSGGPHAAAPNGTPEAGAQVATAADVPFRVQSIDPGTGQVIWSQQTAPGAMSVSGQVTMTGPVTVSPGETAEMCAVDVEDGRMMTVMPGGSAVAGSAGGEGGRIIVGSVTGGVFTPALTEDGQPAVVAVGTGQRLDPAAIASASDDSGVYLQLEDGTLVKVAAQPSLDEQGHQEGSDDSGSGDTTDSENDER